MMFYYHCALPLTKDMIWKDLGTTVARNGIYEYKYRKGGKTLCSLYARENCLGFMIIFGKDERLKFEENRESYSAEVQKAYDEAQTYHDGKWIMFYPEDDSLFPDFMRLLEIKRKTNRKR